MATLMSGSAVRLPRALPTWLRAGKRSPREIWPQLLAGLLGALLIWQCVRLLWTLLTPLSPLGAWQPQAAVIASPADRRALFSQFDPFFRSNAQGPASTTVTSAGLTLYGINLNEATGGGSAIIAGEDGIQTSYAVGDEIAPGLKLAGIAFDHSVVPHHVEVAVGEIVRDRMEVARERTAIAAELDGNAALPELGHLRGRVVTTDATAENEIPRGPHRRSELEARWIVCREDHVG